MKYSVSDWRSKLGKKADMRTTVITAAERFRHLEPSIAGTNAFKARENGDDEQELTDEDKQQRLRDLIARAKKRNLLTMPGSHNPPIAGVLSGHEWNKFIKEVWSHPDNIVIHSIIMPAGKDPRQVSLTGARLKSSKIRSADDDDSLRTAYPSTVTGPSDPFEALVETDCIPPSRFIPNHFLVAKTKTLEHKKAPTDAQGGPDLTPAAPSVWYKEAVHYSALKAEAAEAEQK